MFLGLFIFAQDLVKFDLVSYKYVTKNAEIGDIYIYIHTCWVAEDLIFSCFMEKIYSDLVLFFLTITITLACQVTEDLILVLCWRKYTLIQ